MMDFIVRFTQCHETFRLAELRALTEVEDIELEVKDYRAEVSYPSPLIPPHSPDSSPTAPPLTLPHPPSLSLT